MPDPTDPIDPIAPSPDELAAAYRTTDAAFAGHQQAEAVAIGADGITVLCSANPGGDAEHTWLVRLDDDGGVRWGRHYPVSHGTGRALAPLPGGGFAIAGELRRPPLDYQAYLLRVDGEGRVLAGATLGPPGLTGFTAVAVLDDGSTISGGAAAATGWLVRADRVPRALWDLTVDDTDDVRGVASLGAGQFAVAAPRGRSTTGFGTTRIVGYDAERQPRWSRTLPERGRGEPVALARLGDGGLVLLGHHADDDRAEAALWIVRLTAAGQVVWQRLLGEPGESRRASAVAALGDGGVIIAGEARRDDRRGLRIARLAADGTPVWQRSLGGAAGTTGASGASDVTARGLAATGDGGAILVGSTTATRPGAAGKTNAWIVRLDARGDVRWERAYGAGARPPSRN